MTAFSQTFFFKKANKADSFKTQQKQTNNEVIWQLQASHKTRYKTQKNHTNVKKNTQHNF